MSIDTSKWDEVFENFVDGDIEETAAEKLRPLFDLLVEGVVFDQNDWRDRVIAELGLGDIEALW